MSDVLRCPVCSCAHSLCTLRMRSRVQRASGIPCALCLSRAKNTCKPRAQYAARMRNCIHRHCEPPGRANARPMTGSAKQSIAPHKGRKNGLLRCARNDVEGMADRGRNRRAIPNITTAPSAPPGLHRQPRCCRRWSPRHKSRNRRGRAGAAAPAGWRGRARRCRDRR